MSPKTDDPVVRWLLDSDPSIRWQAMRDLLDLPASDYTPEREKVEHEGWGRELFSHQDADGEWGGGAFAPTDVPWNTWKEVGQPWTATSHSISQLRHFGLDPKSTSAKRTVELVGRNCKWEEGGQRYWDGETEECINGRTLADGAYFGAPVGGILALLLGQRQPDGGWSCRRADGHRLSAPDTTINVLEGLLEYAKAKGDSEAIRVARKSGEEYLLKRNLYKRLSVEEKDNSTLCDLVEPPRWHYNILRALDYFRDSSNFTGEPPDDRLAEAVKILADKKQSDGKWSPDTTLKGKIWFEMDHGPGSPSPWITLKALRVLKWWDQHH